MSETIRKFGSDFEQIDEVKSADKILIEDASDGVVKYAKPGQINKAIETIVEDLGDAEETLAALKKDLETVEGAVNDAKEAVDAANTAVNNIGAKVEQTDTGATVTVTDADGTETTAELTNGKDGTDGQDGTDGVSPTVDVKETDTGHEVTVTDVNGSQTFEVKDGESGDGKYLPLSGGTVDGNLTVEDYAIFHSDVDIYGNVEIEGDVKINSEGRIILPSGVELY